MFFRTPQLPNEFRRLSQITCIRCQHIFVVSEAKIGGSDPDQTLQKPTDKEIDLFFQRDRATQPVTSPPFAEPIPPAGQLSREPSFNHINCPRCGADNRNWLHMLNGERDNQRFTLNLQRILDEALPQDIFPFQTLIIRLTILLTFAAVIIAPGIYFVDLLTNLDAAQIATPTIIVGSIISVVIIYSLFVPGTIYTNDATLIMGGIITPVAAYLAFLVLYVRDPSAIWSQTAPFTTFVFLGGFLPSVYLPREWQSVLQNYRLRHHLPAEYQARQRLQRPHLQNAIALTLMLAFFAPIIGYYGLPLVINILFGPIDLGQQPDTAPIVAALQADLGTWLADETLPEGQRAELTTLRERVQAASTAETAPNSAAIGRIVAHVETAVATDALNETDIQNSLNGHLNQLKKAIAGSSPHRFVAIWILAVGLFAGAGSYVGGLATRSMAAQADRQLPRPIYASIAGMTRLVAWEAKIALELADEIHAIEWIRAQRNDQGGLHLRGLYRSPASYNDNGRLAETPVRATHYVIDSDIWGGIISARAFTDRVPPATGAPIYKTEAPAAQQTTRHNFVTRRQ